MLPRNGRGVGAHEPIVTPLLPFLNQYHQEEENFEMARTRRA